MNPSVIGWGGGLFAFCLAAHVALWRLARPRNDLFALLLIFAVLPLLPVSLLLLGGASPWDAAAALVLHWAMASAYVQTYPTFQAVAPSLEILLLVSSSPDGLTAAEIARHFDDDRLVSNRVSDLSRTSLAREENGVYRLTAWGRAMILAFSLYRKILGLEFKGG